MSAQERCSLNATMSGGGITEGDASSSSFVRSIISFISSEDIPGSMLSVDSYCKMFICKDNTIRRVRRIFFVLF